MTIECHVDADLAPDQAAILAGWLRSCVVRWLAAQGGDADGQDVFVSHITTRTSAVMALELKSANKAQEGGLYGVLRRKRELSATLSAIRRINESD